MKHLALAALLSALPLAAHAQAPARGPNGGMVAAASGHDIEMVSTGTDLVFFLYDENKKPTSGSGARAVVQDGGRSTTVPLTPGAPNRLVGTLPAPLGTGAKVVVSATLADGDKVQARFSR